MKRLGLDIGDKHIGVSECDLMGSIASPIKTIDRISSKQAISEIVELAIDRAAKEIVIGLPKNMNGEIGDQAQSVLTFTNQLRKKIEYSDKFEDIVRPTIVMWDERLTTVAAHKSLIKAGIKRGKRKDVVDQLAAMYILQGYLDSLRLASE